MKKIYVLLFFAILLSSLIQFAHFIRKINDLQQTNEDMFNVIQLQKEDIRIVLLTNLKSCLVQEEIMPVSSDSVYLIIDYPLCSACFKGVVGFLSDYSKNQNMRLIICCDEFYIPIIKKKLIFDEIGNVAVRELINVKHFPTKMTIAFKSKSQNYFYLPLPNNREVDFLEAFFKL